MKADNSPSTIFSEPQPGGLIDLKKYIIYFFMILIISIILSAIQTKLNYNVCRDSVFIPDQDMITIYCQKNGYDSGWLSSSSCGKNQVQCHSQLLGLEKYECVDWYDKK